MSSRARIHPTAILAEGAVVADDVTVGPYAIVGPHVRISAGCTLMSHVIIDGATTIGEGNVFHPFCVIGGEPQVRKKDDDGVPAARTLSIGAHNVFREHVTVNVASGPVPTTIGSHNLLMAASHVAHDVVLGSRCVVANGVQLAGHVIVEDWVTFGGFAGVAQWSRVGQSAFVAAGAMCERDVPPFVIVQGDRARVRALNLVGLERRGVPTSSIGALKRAFAKVFVRRAASFDGAVLELDKTDPFVAAFARSLGATQS